MTVSFRCSCGQKLRAKQELAGRQTRCPKCGLQVLIPATSDDSSPQIKTGTPIQPDSVEQLPQIDLGPAAQAAPAPAPTPAPAPAPVPVQTPGAAASVDLMIPCGSCGQSFRMSSEFAGKQIPCPTCSALCTIPSIVTQPSTEPAPAPQQAPIPHQAPAPIPMQNPAPVDPGMGYDPYAMETPTPTPQFSRPANEFRFLRIGLLIIAIAMCVSAGSYAMWFLGEGMIEVAFAMVAQRAPDPPERPNYSGMSREQFDREMREYNEKVRAWSEKVRKISERQQKRVKSAENMIKVSFVFLKIAHVVLLLSLIATIVGGVFSCLNPRRPGIMGVAIAITAMLAFGSIFQMVFQTLPILDIDSPSSVATRSTFGANDLEYRGHFLYVFIWPLEADVSDVMLGGFVDVLIFGALIMCGVLLFLVGNATDHKGTRTSGLISIVSVYVFLAFALVLFIMALVEFDASDFKSTTPLIIVWVFKWLANVGLGIGLFFLIRGFFIAWMSTNPNRSGLRKQSRPAHPGFR